MKKTGNPKTKKTRQTVLPPAIQQGDTLGLVAPAGPLISRKNFRDGIHILERKGFKLKYSPRLLNAKGYLSGSDQARADEFNSMWADPEIKAIVAARGGYGSLRMVDLIDMRLIRKHPKILVGFSDLTVLLTAIFKKTGLVTFHGPVVTTLASIDRKSLTAFFNVLSGNTPRSISPGRLQILKGGSAKGLLLGGNLTTLVHMIATPHEFPWDRAILFIEDIGECPYRLDRLLTHLSRAGRLQKIKGIILGTFSDDERKENRTMQKTVHTRVVELLKGTRIPVWANFPVGHSRRNLTIPIGMNAAMDSDSGSLLLK